MPVIKHMSAQSFTRDAIVLDMSDLRSQAERILVAAQAQADRILAEAQAKAAELAAAGQTDGQKKGFEQGLAQGLEQGRKSGHAEALAKASAQLQVIQKSWIAAASAWDEQRDPMEREASAAVLRLGLLFAEKVVRRKIETDSQVIVDQVAEALAYVLRPCDVAIRVNPADRPAINESMPQLLATLTHLNHVKVEDDPSVSRGGCTLAYGQGRVDATVETQLRRLVELLIPQGSAQDATAPESGEVPTPLPRREGPGEGRVASVEIARDQAERPTVP